MLRVSQSTRQEWCAVTVDGLNDAGSKKVMIGVDGQDVSPPEPMGIIGKVFGIAKMDNPLAETLLCLAKDRRAVAIGLTQYSHFESEFFLLQAVESREEFFRVLVIFPAVVPEDQWWFAGLVDCSLPMFVKALQVEPQVEDFTLGFDQINTLQLILVREAFQKLSQLTGESFKVVL